MSDEEAVAGCDISAEDWPIVLVDFYRAHCVDGLEGKKRRRVGLNKESAKFVLVFRWKPLGLNAFKIKVYTDLAAC